MDRFDQNLKVRLLTIIKKGVDVAARQGRGLMTPGVIASTEDHGTDQLDPDLCTWITTVIDADSAR